jgi:hypothetical protein
MRRQRRISRSSAVAVALALMVGSAGPLARTVGAAPQFTSQFEEDECTFSSTGRNAYFTIRPGDWVLLEGLDDGELVRLKITVLNQTKKITFKTKEGEAMTVVARVVEERESKGGKLVEVSRNFFARCTETNDIFYFGEEVDIYDEDGETIISHDGAWLAGKQGALPGVIMPGRFLLGSRYFQEIAPGVALDRAEHVKMGFTVHAAGTAFEDCVEVKETTPLESGVSIKQYCAELWLVADGVLELVDFNIAAFDE